MIYSARITPYEMIFHDFFKKHFKLWLKTQRKLFIKTIVKCRKIMDMRKFIMRQLRLWIKQTNAKQIKFNKNNKQLITKK